MKMLKQEMLERKNTTLLRRPERSIISNFAHYTQEKEESCSRKSLTVSFLKKHWDQENTIEYKKIQTHQYKTKDLLGLAAQVPQPKKKIQNNFKQTTDLLFLISQKMQKPEIKMENKLNNESIIKNDSSILEQNIKTREKMEDFISITKDFLNDSSKILYILCDGHCGDQVAKIVVNRLPEIFGESLKLFNYDVDKSLNESFRKMDEELVDYEDTGTTCNLIYICVEGGKKVIYSANVGDSRSILINNKDSRRLSYDHKATDKSEITRVRKEGGIILRGRLYTTLAITRAFGDYSFKIDVKGLSHIPHITQTIIDENDKYIIIASDGIWDVISDERAFELVHKGNFDSSEDIAKLFVKASMEFGSKDNISCIVVKLN